MKKGLIAATLAAFLLAGCETTSVNEESYIEINNNFNVVENNLINKHSYINTINTMGDNEILVNGPVNAMTVKDFKYFLYADSTASDYFCREILNFILRNTYTNSEDDLKKFIAEHVVFNQEQTGETTSGIRKVDAMNYISLIKAADSTFSISEEDKISFYNQYIDKDMYPSINNYPDLEAEIIFSKLNDHDSNNEIYKKILADFKDKIEFNDLNIKDFNTTDYLNNFLNKGFSTQLWGTIYDDIFSLPDDTIIVTFNSQKLTLKEIKQEILYANGENVFSKFVVYDSTISDFLKNHTLSDELDAIWKQKYSNYHSDTLEMKMYRDYIASLYQKYFEAGTITKDILVQFKNNKDGDENFYYSNVEFDKINLIDLSYEYMLENNLISNIDIVDLDAKIKEFNFFDNKLISIVTNFLKTI